MALLDKTVAFLVSALAGMGVGGGGLFVIYLTFARGADQLSAQGTNLLFFLAGAVPALAVHLRKRKLCLFAMLTVGLAGVCGTLLGAYLIAHTEPGLLRKAFGVLLLLSGAAVLFKKK
ncbi:MAG: sulfite exporter TauE/SafE family protein [Clostridia bacterium]|nr:sulfite exporter TauE/SafE family protein [Clostridia bacterium]